MKEEFLKNFKIGDQPLPDEIVKAILDENQRDADAAKAPYADYESLKDQLKTAKDGLKAFEGVDVAQLQSKITELQGQLTSKDAEWKENLEAMAFDGKVKDAIAAAKGRNAKAISALLDMDALRASKNQELDIKAALEALQKENGYLFGADDVPPPYAGGTGGNGPQPSGDPTTLAGALRAKYNM